MLEVFGRPLILYVLAGLARAGVRRATVNVAWLAGAFEGLPRAAAPLGIEVSLSTQERPLMHGGDLAYAAAFLGSLSPDEVFLAVNGDTIVEYDAPALARLAAHVDARAPVLVLGERSPSGSLRAWPDGTLAGIGEVDYEPGAATASPPPAGTGRPCETAGPSAGEERWDDLGMRLLHAGVRPFLPPAGTEMSLYGAYGLVGGITAAGRHARVAAAPAVARAEIGTVAEYEGAESNARLRELAARLIPPSAGGLA